MQNEALFSMLKFHKLQRFPPRTASVSFHTLWLGGKNSQISMKIQEIKEIFLDQLFLKRLKYCVNKGES